MKRALIISTFLVLFGGYSFGQSPIVGMFPADRFMVDLFTDIWRNTPQAMDINTINRGVNISLFYDFPIGTSSFSFAVGAGYTGHNLYSDHQYTWIGPNFDFTPIHEGDQWELRNNKLNLNYLNIPLEFRFRSRGIPNTIRASAGLRTGYLVQASTKVHLQGTDNSIRESIKFKELQLENIRNFQIGATARLGYGRFNLYGYFPITRIFDGNTVEEMMPVSVGLSLIIF